MAQMQLNLILNRAHSQSWQDRGENYAHVCLSYLNTYKLNMACDMPV